MALDGTWELSFNTPLGARTITVALTANDDALRGTITGDRGSQAFEGTVDGDAFAWTTIVPGPIGPLELHFDGRVEGDELGGRVTFGGFGSDAFRGVRA